MSERYPLTLRDGASITDPFAIFRDQSPPYTPTQEDITLTQAAEQQLNRDPLAELRPLTQAVWSTVLELAPQIPRMLLNKHLTEAEVFKFLECLEKHGYKIVPLELKI